MEDKWRVKGKTTGALRMTWRSARKPSCDVAPPITTPWNNDNRHTQTNTCSHSNTHTNQRSQTRKPTHIPTQTNSDEAHGFPERAVEIAQVVFVSDFSVSAQRSATSTIAHSTDVEEGIH